MLKHASVQLKRFRALACGHHRHSLVALVMVAAMLVGCGAGNSTKSQAAPTSAQTSAPASGAATPGTTSSGSATTTPAPAPAPAPTIQLTAAPASITAGQSAVLSWASTNATAVSIQPGSSNLPATGTVTVTPTATTTYTATATGSAGTATATATVTVAAAPASAVPHSQHVFVVIEENHSLTEALANMAWLTSEAQANGYAANYISNDGGSALDYFWLSSGSDELQFGCDGWGCPQTITDDNIFRELDKRGLNWKLYAQSLPYAGYVQQTDVGAYAVRHNPAIWYSDIVNGSAAYQQQHIVPDTQLATDLAANTLPSFAFIIPDVNNDAHDGTLQQADIYLQNTVAPLLNSSDFQSGGDGLLIVTFDECGGGTNSGCGGQVLTALIGPKVVPHTVSNIFYQHQNTLRTVLDALGVNTYPGAAATASDMSDFFAH